MNVAIAGNAAVRKDELPACGVGWVLRIRQRRYRQRICFPKCRHLRDLGARKRDRGISARACDGC